MRYSGKILGFIIMAAIVASGLVFQAAGAERTETLTNDDILKMDFLRSFHLTPGGTSLSI
jgi:hypothetical protein